MPPNKSVSEAKSRLATLHRRAVSSTPEQISEAKAALAAAKIEAAINNALTDVVLNPERAHRIASMLLAGGDAR